MSLAWDPDRYLAYADERGRPFLDLIGRVAAADPRVVVDLGCGPGNLTSRLADRWPAAAITGVDSSEAMIRVASDSSAADRVVFHRADLRDWLAAAPAGGVDVLVSNATLQWLPDHLDLLPALVRAVTPGGWLAVQVPGNHEEPSHTIRAELAATPPYAAHTNGVARPGAHDPVVYLRALQALGCVVDAWETTYLHVLHGPDPVFTWISGTGARPTLQALPDELRPRFEEELKARLRVAYPEDGHGVVLPFRRIFVVARVGA
ncbi:methyltransferase domain-containing protein [Nocardioides carbamazepini]|jgi:trans-aconitate 2-methyltransferase|uniref:methyltransferase domain-containing protein n=1 Tax=Nocardioides carbamazepini TaxID=2854259 RepID=UPI002149EC97|nr:methyltransferase domain-containing protein [Nocardioides carbamazepini]MCR1786422.1 methyltransferase domain-containing protein [Nocardioides carbamazepini]